MARAGKCCFHIPYRVSLYTLPWRITWPGGPRRGPRDPAKPPAAPKLSPAPTQISSRVVLPPTPSARGQRVYIGRIKVSWRMRRSCVVAHTRVHGVVGRVSLRSPPIALQSHCFTCRIARRSHPIALQSHSRSHCFTCRIALFAKF